MKRFFIILLMMGFVAAPIQAQVSKNAKKEAKALTKEGWETVPSVPSIEEQLRYLYETESEMDERGCPRYVYGKAKCIGGNYNVAKMQATYLAKVNLAGDVQSEIVANINKVVDQNEKEYIIKTISSKTEIYIGKTTTIMEIYRKDSQGIYEVQIVLCCEYDGVKNVTMNAISEDLDKYDPGLIEKVNKALSL